MTIESSPAVALEPCPCCGSEAFSHAIEQHTHGPLASHMPDHPGSGYVECTGCNLAMAGTSEPEAIAAWNHRIAPRTLAETALTDNQIRETIAETEGVPAAWVDDDAVRSWLGDQAHKESTPAETGEVEELKADLKDEINFDLNTRINKVPESVVDQVVDLLAERGLLALTAPPPSSGWEAGAEAMREKAEETLRELSRDAEMTAGVSPERVVNAAFIIKAEVLWSAANAVMDTPLPPPPSKEGAGA